MTDTICNRLNMINVTPLLPGREKEIADALKKMYRDGVISSAATCMTLVPEGNPVIDKASRLAELHRKLTDEMKDCDMPIGILLQATMGMGWVPDERAEYSKFTKQDGTELYVFCPLNKDFLTHIHGAVSTAAKLKPDFFMVDDDTRMLTCRGGCFCPLHISLFNERTGMSFTRETLLEALQNDPGRWAKPWDDLQRDSVAGLAKTIRSAIDTADPAAPVYFCQCSADAHHAPYMIQALTAPGQKPVLRINNGAYLNDSPSWMPYWMMRTMWQVCAMPKEYTLLSETDTCPQNRYSTSAAFLNLHYAWSTLAGCRGAKLWITQLNANLMEETGRKYREVLREHAGFYRAIAGMKPEWQGFAEVLPASPDRTWCPESLQEWPQQPRPTWGADVFAFLGIPFSFEPYRRGIKRTIVLSEKKLPYFRDDELREMLSGNVLADGGAAIALTSRGFSDLLGLRAEKWDLPAASCERGADGTEMVSGAAMVKLTDLQPGAEIRSTLYHKGFVLSAERIAVGPGLVKYRNPAGGNIMICAAQLREHPGSGFAPFGMLNHNRKLWLARELGIGMFYSGTAPLYFALFTDRGQRCAVAVNMGLDVETELPLANVPADVNRMEMLGNDGVWREAEFADGIISCSLPPAGIAFFRY